MVRVGAHADGDTVTLVLLAIMLAMSSDEPVQTYDGLAVDEEIGECRVGEGSRGRGQSGQEHRLGLHGESKKRL